MVGKTKMAPLLKHGVYLPSTGKLRKRHELIRLNQVRVNSKTRGNRPLPTSLKKLNSFSILSRLKIHKYQVNNNLYRPGFGPQSCNGATPLNFVWL